MAPTPILLLHGLASSHETTWSIHGWEDLLAGLGYEAVPFALPGHGGAAELLSDDVHLAVRDAAEASGAHSAMGFSAGAALLMNVSVAFPKLFGTRVHLGIGDHAFRVRSAELQDRARALTKDLTGGDPWSRSIVRSVERAGLELHQVAGYLADSLPPPSMRRLASVGGRSLFVVGADDPSGPLDAVQELLSETVTVVVQGCDHFHLPAHPQAMRAVATFLS